MRVIDILSESILTEDHLKSKDFKERYRLANLIDKLKHKKPFHALSGDPIIISDVTPAEIKELEDFLKNNFDPKDPSPKAQPVKPFTIPNTIGGVRLSTLQKTNEFGGKIARDASGEQDYTKANLGPTVEALKAFAMYAKLIMREKEHITVEDVLAVGKLADENSQITYSKNEKTGAVSNSPTTLAVYIKDVPDANKQVQDHLTLKVALSTPSFKRAVLVTPTDQEAWGNLQGIVKYVNEENDINKYTRLFKNNNKRDPIKIAVVGIGGLKTDIQASRDNEAWHEGMDPKLKEKNIKSLSLSVKAAGAKWYDQAPGNKLEGWEDFYKIIGLDTGLAAEAITVAGFIEGGKVNTIAGKKAFEKRVQASHLMYEFTWHKLQERMASLNDKGEADYIHHFLANLKKGIAGDETLVYVKFDANGTYEKLKPHLLMDLANVINLDVNLGSGERPTIYWIDKDTGRTLIWVVCAKTPSEQRLTHQFNLGKDFFPLLREAEKRAFERKQQGNTKLTTTSSGQAPLEVKQREAFLGWATRFADQRRVTDRRIIPKIANVAFDLRKAGTPEDGVIAELERQFPQLTNNVIKAREVPTTQKLYTPYVPPTDDEEEV